jgi:hypothetical protein
MRRPNVAQRRDLTAPRAIVAARFIGIEKRGVYSDKARRQLDAGCLRGEQARAMRGGNGEFGS